MPLDSSLDSLIPLPAANAAYPREHTVCILGILAPVAIYSDLGLWDLCEAQRKDKECRMDLRILNVSKTTYASEIGKNLSSNSHDDPAHCRIL
jgi:hypothetical protein